MQPAQAVLVALVLGTLPRCAVSFQQQQSAEVHGVAFVRPAAAHDASGDTGARTSGEAYAAPPPVTSSPAAGVLLLQGTHLDRLAEVVGVVDVHEPGGGEAAAMELLRERAFEMGADAVVGVEFHHGDAPGEPTHLSGMAVRYVARP
jgi:hypothetical protein